MQPHQSSRIDLVELKTQILNKVGEERSKKYFYNLNRFLSQKLSKSEFDKSCFRFLGRENVPLHNQLIRSILKNAFQAKTPPPKNESGPTKSAIQLAKGSTVGEDHEQGGALIPNQHPNSGFWSNGVLPVSPRKVRTGVRGKTRDRPSPLGPNGKVDCISHQSVGTEDSGSKHLMENGEVPPCDFQRPMRHLQVVAELPEHEREGSFSRPSEILRTHKGQSVFVEDGEEGEKANHRICARSPLRAPLGIPFCPASVGGSRKVTPVASSSDLVSYYNSGGLSDTEMLRKRMEEIASAQGLEGVSFECASMLNNMLDVYLKRLIKSCVDLVEARSPQDLIRHQVPKQQIQGKVMNGIWPSNHLHLQSTSGSAEVTHEQRSRCSISLLDFKVAMELNPQQLGEDWPLLLEKICMQAFEH